MITTDISETPLTVVETADEMEDGRPAVHAIVRLIKEKVGDVERLSLSFSRAQQRVETNEGTEREALSSNDDEGRSQSFTSDQEGSGSGGGSGGGAPSGKVKQISMLKLARKARVPLTSLLESLADTGDKRDVRVRNIEDNGTGTGSSESDALIQKARSSPIRYVDVTFNEGGDAHSPLAAESRPQTSLTPPCGFGLLLSPSLASNTENEEKKEDAFQAWLDESPNAGQKNGKVSVAVEMPPKMDLAAQALLVLDPTTGRDENAPPQWVFAVPTAPGKSPTLEQRLFPIPSEVSSVTVYCENGVLPRLNSNESTIPSALVVVSIELSRPTWAWGILFVMFCCNSVSQSIATYLHHFTPATSVALWWTTAQTFGFMFLFIITMLLHHWEPHEIALLKDPKHGVLPLAILGLSYGVYTILWVNASNVEGDNDVTKLGPTSQSAALASVHPILILFWRMLRRKNVFTGEIVGTSLLTIGMFMIAWPNGEWSGTGSADGFGGGSSFFIAGYIVLMKMIVSQLPLSIVLLLPSVVSFLLQLIVVAISGDASTIFGWASHPESKWWLALMILSTVSCASLVHCLRYLHPLALSVSLAASTMISLLWSNYAFPDMVVSNGFGSSPLAMVLGILVLLVGCIAVIYSAAVRRQHVDIEVSNQAISKRQRLKNRLTSSALQKSQDTYGSQLYASASKNQTGVD